MRGTMHATKKLWTPDAADFLKVSASTLAKWRVFGGGPKFQKIGARIVVYDLRDLEEFAAQGGRRSTSEE